MDEFDKGSVRALLAEQHPDLAGMPIAAVPGGWDNQQWRLGHTLAVRLPRSDSAEALLRREQRWLPHLSATATLPIPRPVRIGKPSARFPRAWTVTTWVPGEPADHSPITAAKSACDLAAFLRALHRAAPADAPRDTSRGVPLTCLTDTFGDRLDAVADHVDTIAIRTVWDHALAAPRWDGPDLWLHADLHPANVITTDAALAGIIDFGNLCAGDPATDLAAAWTILPAGTSQQFFTAYGADEATVNRARGWAVLQALMLIAIGLAGDRGLPGGKPTWGPCGRAALAGVTNSALDTDT